MNIAIIEINLSEPLRWLDDVPGLRHDPGGYVYRIYYEDGSKRIGGSSNGLDRNKALSLAKNAAKVAGFTHYRMLDETADLIPLGQC